MLGMDSADQASVPADAGAANKNKFTSSTTVSPTPHIFNRYFSTGLYVPPLRLAYKYKDRHKINTDTIKFSLRFCKKLPGLFVLRQQSGIWLTCPPVIVPQVIARVTDVKNPSIYLFAQRPLGIEKSGLAYGLIVMLMLSAQSGQMLNPLGRHTLQGIDFFPEGVNPVLFQNCYRLLGLVHANNNYGLPAFSPA